jgi:hypothetical protein
MLNNLEIVMNKSSIDLSNANVVRIVDSRGMACPYPSFEMV